MSDSTDLPPGSTHGTADVHHAAEAGPANHRSLVYEHRDEQLAAVVPFVRDGLEQGDKVVYVADETPVDTLLESFAAAGIDVDAALESDALSVHTTEDLYGSVDAFDAETVIDGIDERVRSVAASDEFDRLRLTGEMTWALSGDDDTLDTLVEYERTLNAYYPGKPVLALCQYNRTRFDDDLLADILRAHPQQVYDATVTQNFAYVPPERFSADASPVGGTDAFVETQLDRVRARGALESRERAMADLAESAGDLLAGDRETVFERTVSTLDRVLSAPLTGVAVYDESTDSLDLAAVSAGTVTDPAATLPEEYRDRLQEAFVTDESARFSDESATSDCNPLGDPLRSGLVAPFDRRGVVFAASTRADSFEPADVGLVETVARLVQGALDRADREETLERQNERLRRLSETNTTIRRIQRALVGAASRREIDTAVCERLAERYRFVWLGERDPLTDAVVARAWAGDGDLFLDEYHDDASVADRRGPAHAALERGAPCVVQNVLTCTEFDRWRRAALDHGYRSTVSVPLVHERTEYGVLNVYTGTANRLSELEQQVVAELGDTIAYAIDATQTKTGRHTDQATRVSMQVTDDRSRLRRLARAVGTSLDVQTLLPESDGQIRVFFTADDVTADHVLSSAEALSSVRRIRHLADSDRGGLFQATLAVESALSTFLGRFDVSTGQLVATPAGLDVVVDLPARADVRAFVDELKTTYPETTVTAIQRSTTPMRTPASFFASLEERLTERQLQVLRVAYHAGYFAWPRHSTAEEVAESLDITQPTFAKHLRTSERKLLSLLFDGEQR